MEGIGGGDREEHDRSGHCDAPLLTDAVKSRIECPTMLCVGELDTTAIPDDTRTFARGIRNADVVVLPNTRHPFETVDLSVLIPLIEGFWTKVGT
jgi:pimeloyl-ACP methyl ester carboxylesterase